MFGWAFALAVIALFAAILGFGGLAGALAKIAIVVFVIAAAGAILMAVLGWKAAKSITS